MYCVYIITNYTKSTLYIGVTNNLVRRMEEHKNGLVKGFSKKYNLRYLVYYEESHDVFESIEREKQLKNELITDFNPNWNDLSAEL